MGRQPTSIEPMTATLADAPFSDPAWVYEPKLDGVRALARREGDGVTLLSRSGKGLERTYPELVEALAADPCEDFVIDGEVVAFEDGRTSFERLQGRMGLADPRAALATGIAVHLYVFDLLWLHGRDTTGVTLRQRKALLAQALAFEGNVHLVGHSEQRGEELFAEACRQGMEGLIAKRADSTYRGGRSRDWLKLKCSSRQELVIGGFTAPRGRRNGFGALLVGHYVDGKLRYAGKVGSGFDAATLADLGGALRSIESGESPFESFGAIPAATRWVVPRLVCEVAFTEWTREGRLRHPRFVGLREDTDARDVVRERPVRDARPG